MCWLENRPVHGWPWQMQTCIRLACLTGFYRPALEGAGLGNRFLTACVAMCGTIVSTAEAVSETWPNEGGPVKILIWVLPSSG